MNKSGPNLNPHQRSFEIIHYPVEVNGEIVYMREREALRHYEEKARCEEFNYHCEKYFFEPRKMICGRRMFRASNNAIFQKN